MSDSNFHAANSLFRSGNYESAKEQYKDLLVKYPFFKDIITNQILMCENKIIKKNESNNKDFESIFYPTIDFGWVAVITMWKRTSYLEEQLDSIFNQSIKPNEIIIIQNENHFELDLSIKEKYNIKLIKSDINSLYTRWIISYLSDAKYVCVFDDDVIPGRKWIESCIRTCEKYNALIGPSGRVARVEQSPAWESVDIRAKNPELNCSEKDVEADWVCNSYFFKIEWIKYIVEAPRYKSTQKTFDDIQLAVTLKKYGNISTYVPMQNLNDLDFNGHIKREYGHDEYALWKRQKSEHTEKRGELINSIDSVGFKWVQNGNK